MKTRREILAVVGASAVAGCSVLDDSRISVNQLARLAGDAGPPVAISDGGSTVITGGSGDADSGSASIFTSDGDWSQETTLLPDTGHSSSVAMSGDGTTALVGVVDVDREDPVSVHVLTKNGGWSQRARLTPDISEVSKRFSLSVALSGDGTTAFVGVGDVEREFPVSAHVFTDNGGWSHRVTLIPPLGEVTDPVTLSVALSDNGTTALVGYNSDSGNAYVYTSDGGWSQQATLADTDKGGLFGGSVALSGDGSTALVGAPWDTSGTVSVFDRKGDWSKSATLTIDDYFNSYFGFSVALSSDGATALIGAKNDDEHGVIRGGTGGGSAFVFTDDDGWSRQAKVVAKDGKKGEQFGDSVALSGNATTAVIGSESENEAGFMEDPHLVPGYACVFSLE